MSQVEKRNKIPLKQLTVSCDEVNVTTAYTRRVMA